MNFSFSIGSSKREIEKEWERIHSAKAFDNGMKVISGVSLLACSQLVHNFSLSQPFPYILALRSLDIMLFVAAAYLFMEITMIAVTALGKMGYLW